MIPPCDVAGSCVSHSQKPEPICLATDRLAAFAAPATAQGDLPRPHQIFCQSLLTPQIQTLELAPVTCAQSAMLSPLIVQTVLWQACELRKLRFWCLLRPPLLCSMPLLDSHG